MGKRISSKVPFKIILGATLLGIAGCNPRNNRENTWSAYKADANSSSYSSLDQINQSNVSQLETAWKMKLSALTVLSLVVCLISNVAIGQTLSEKQRAISLIAAFTTKGDIPKLKLALNAGLDAGLTINECKEVLVHLYAYCGFPRSIQGLNTLIATLDERKAKGIKDNKGKEATPVNDTDKYKAGWMNLARLSGGPTDGQIEKPKSGYGAFSPEIDRFLKEHLFADLFSRDVLTFAERELTTISVLIALGSGVEPMLASHLGLTMKQGFTRTQIEEVFELIEQSVSKADAEAARKVFSKISSLNSD